MDQEACSWKAQTAKRSAKISRGRTMPVDSRAGRISAMKMTERSPKGPKPDFERPAKSAAARARSQAVREKSGMQEEGGRNFLESVRGREG